MTPADFKEARHQLGLTMTDRAPLLGYYGKNGDRLIRRMEGGTRTIRPAQIRLMRAYLDGYRPADWPKEE